MIISVRFRVRKRAGRWLVLRARDIQRHAHHDARSHTCNAFDLGNTAGKAQWCAFELRKDIRKAVCLIVLCLRDAK